MSQVLLLGAGLATALYVGGRYLLNLNRLSQTLETSVTVNIHQVSLRDLELRLQVTLKNPSQGHVTVQQPYLTLLHNETTLASSQVSKATVRIAPVSEVKLPPIWVRMSFLRLAGYAPALLKAYRETGMLTVQVRIQTVLNNTVTYTKTETIKLGSQGRR